MARYSKITRRMWVDQKFMALTHAQPNGQTLWVRLLTGPELTCIPGVFPAREAGLADALGWTLEGFRKAFREVSEKGMAKADWKAGLVWVPRAIEHNKPESANVVKGWAKTWIELPECELKEKSYQELKAFLQGMSKGFLDAFLKGCADPSRNQEQEQEQEQDLFPEDTETDHSPPTEAKSSRKKNGKPKLVKPEATQAPDDLDATDATVKAAEEINTDWSKHWIDCRDFMRSVGEGRADWNAALRNWMRKPARLGMYPLKPNGQQLPLVRSEFAVPKGFATLP